MSDYDPRQGPQPIFRPPPPALEENQRVNPGPDDEPDDFDFTEEHIAAANLAHANGKVIVLDRGPAEPEPVEHPEGERTDAEIEAENRAAVLAKREHDEWHAKHKEPVAVTMDKIDADHAVNSDPKRYVHVPRGVRSPVTIEERLTSIERRLGPETPEETKKIRERNEKLAAERQAKSKEAHDKRVAAQKAEK
jgi:hypothetical protein